MIAVQMEGLVELHENMSCVFWIFILITGSMVLSTLIRKFQFNYSKIFAKLNMSNQNHSNVKNSLSTFKSNNLRKFASHKRNYTTKAAIKANALTNNHINSWFITGFMDAEGSFMVLLRTKSKGYVTGWGVEAVFQIKLHKKDEKLLELIQDYFL